MKTNFKNKRNEKGITLVALVVTIVVLLILAGVTIVTLFGESGIITKAQKAADETKNGVKNDLEGLKDLEGILENATAPEIKNKGELVPVSTKYAKYTDNTSSEPAYIPGGYCVVNDSTTDTDNARKVNTIANGLVISDLANDTLDNEINEDGKQGNQFVWVPVPDISSMYDKVNNAGKLYDYGTKSLPKAAPEVINYPTKKNSGYREPDVVTGAPSGNDSTTGKQYDADIGRLNIITDFKVEAGQTKIAKLFKDYLQDEFDKMIESVKKYKGFYIGRYETSGVSSSNIATVPTVKKGGTVGGGNWYYNYQQIKNMAKNNSNVTTSMIWGCQWDRTLNWFIETGTSIAQIVDSTSWGNHSNNTEEGYGRQQTSGYRVTWQKNHIYDMAGNVYDWTMEVNGTSDRVVRGGLFGGPAFVRPASDRFNYNPTGSNSYFRLSIYTLYKSISQLN